MPDADDAPSPEQASIDRMAEAFREWLKRTEPERDARGRAIYRDDPADGDG